MRPYSEKYSAKPFVFFLGVGDPEAGFKTIREKSLETENMATYHELRSVSTSDVPLNFRKVTLDSSIFEKHLPYFWIHLQHLSVVICAIYQDTRIWVPSTLIPAGCLNVWNSESNRTWLDGKHSQLSSVKTHEEIMCGWIVTGKP